MSSLHAQLPHWPVSLLALGYFVFRLHIAELLINDVQIMISKTEWEIPYIELFDIILPSWDKNL